MATAENSVPPPRVGISRFVTRKSTYQAEDEKIINAISANTTDLTPFTRHTLDTNTDYVICRLKKESKVDWRGAINETTDADYNWYDEFKYAGKFIEKRYEENSRYPIYKFDHDEFQVMIEQSQIVAHAVPAEMKIVPCINTYSTFLGKCTSTVNTLSYDPETFLIFFPSNLRRGGRTRKSRKCRRRKRSKRTRR
jgi:hypothetical protein